MEKILLSIGKLQVRLENSEEALKHLNDLLYAICTDNSIDVFNCFVFLSAKTADESDVIVSEVQELRGLLDIKEELCISKVAPDMTVDNLFLSVRVYNSLVRAGIHTIADLLGRSEKELMRMRNLGKKGVGEIIKKLNTMGLKLCED